MKQNHSRYSGPELDVLLAEVRAELGHDVQILEANKIRSGGVGGFFAKEMYEVIVDTENVAVVAQSPAERDLLREGVDLAFDSSTIARSTQKLLARAEQAEWPEETEAEKEAEASFATVLRDELARSIDEPAPDEPAMDAAVPAMVESLLGRSEPVPVASIPLEPIPLEPVRSAPSRAVARPGRGFWARLAQARSEPSLVEAVPLTQVSVIAGDLDAALLSARRRQRDLLLTSDALLVMSGRETVTGVPSWQCVADEAGLVAALDTDEPRLVILDSPADARALGPLMGRLSGYGVDAVQLAVNGAPPVAELAQAIRSLGLPTVVELVGTIPAARAIEYFDAGLPIVSIGDHRLTPELLVALRGEGEAFLQSAAPGG